MIQAKLKLKSAFATFYSTKIAFYIAAAVLVVGVIGVSYNNNSTVQAASCDYITNDSTGGQIKGNGVNLPVSVVSGVGNCFSVVMPGTHDGHNWYKWQNGDGHCLWVTQTGVLELGGACHIDSSHPNEEMLEWSPAGNLGEVLWNSVWQYMNNSGPTLIPKNGTAVCQNGVNSNAVTYAAGGVASCKRWLIAH